jgi:predicted alpha/beta hydrolase family esterase
MIVIVYGYVGSGPGHWQRWLADQLMARGADVLFPDLPDPTAPQRDVWVAALAGIVTHAATSVTFVCHSLGCWALDHLLAERGADNVHAALLVAPPSPDLLFEPVQSFLPPPRRRAAWAPLAARTLVIGSDDDDYATPEEIAETATALAVPYRILPGAGHINVAAGYGPWPFVLEWLERVGAVSA